MVFWIFLEFLIENRILEFLDDRWLGWLLDGKSYNNRMSYKSVDFLIIFSQKICSIQASMQNR